MRKIMITTGLVFIAFLIQACASDADQPVLKNTGDANIHAISDWRLRTLMHEMKFQAIEHGDALKSEAEQAIYFSKAADIADSVEASTLFIPGIRERLGLNAQEQEQFTALASELRQQAEEVRWLAIAGGADALRNKMTQMIGTCNSCHDSFRIMPKGTNE